ncbi:MAG TPA: hypothetical protein VEL06_18040 [Haliangiales bacterium]|nr:hypothetical protein [Haliangiales bacterium]
MSKSEPDIIHRTRVAVISLVALLMVGLVGSAVVWRIYVALNAAGLAKAREAIALPKSRYPVDFSPGLAVLSSHLGELKRLAQAASHGALLTLDSNSNEDVAASITTMFGLARTLDEEPSLISQLVRVAIVRMAATTLERGLIVGEWSDADLRGVGSVCAAAAKTNAMMRALIGERASATPYFRMSRKEWEEFLRSDSTTEEGDMEPIESLLPGLLPVLAQATGLFERDLGFYLGAMETNISFLPAVPLDPFDGAPLRYKQLSKGCVVYSIGPDGRDNGGKEPPATRRGTNRVPEDITFTVER